MAEEKRKEEDLQRESGEPGGGRGRRDETGRSGVYPVSSMNEAPGSAPVRGEEEWGQGERGAKGYEDSGPSGLEAFWAEEKERLQGGEGQSEEQKERPEERKKE